MSLKVEAQTKEINTLMEENEKLRIELSDITIKYTEQIKPKWEVKREDDVQVRRLEEKSTYSANGEEITKLQETIKFLMEENDQLKERQELFQNQFDKLPHKEDDKVIKRLVEENMTSKDEQRKC
jgi:regulator of replication initiation timing